MVSVETAFDFRSAEYEGLFDRSSATAFQAPLWLDSLYRHLVPSQGAQALVITVRRPEDGALVALLPLLRRRFRGWTVIEFADLGVSDYASPVLDLDAGEGLWEDPSLRRDVLGVAGRFDLLRISKVREGTPGIADLLGPTSAYVSGTAHAVPLEGPYERWRAQAMDRSRIKEMDQKRRKLGRKGGLRFEALSDGDLVESTFAAMRELRAPRFESRSNRDILTDPAAFAFYVDVARGGMASGFARTYVLSCGDKTLALTFGLWHRGRFLTLLSAFDPAFRTYSPGYLLFEAIIEDLIASGATEFDLTLGDEGYKRDFGTKPTVISSYVRGGSAMGTLGAALIAQPWARSLAQRVTAAGGERSFSKGRR